jgi:hypothetical protein
MAERLALIPTQLSIHTRAGQWQVRVDRHRDDIASAERQLSYSWLPKRAVQAHGRHKRPLVRQHMALTASICVPLSTQLTDS